MRKSRAQEEEKEERELGGKALEVQNNRNQWNRKLVFLLQIVWDDLIFCAQLPNQCRYPNAFVCDYMCSCCYAGGGEESNECG